MSTTTGDLKQVSFPPDVLARIAPDVSLQRHLSLGIRPNLRKFQEFNSIQIGGDIPQLQNNYNNVFASSIIKSGSTTIINTITLGIVENYGETTDKYSSIYPVVEILRGRLGGSPTDEEMIVAQELHETIYHSKLIPSESLVIKPVGICIKQEDEEEQIIYPEENEVISDKSYSFVLLSSIKVYSKHTSTNSLFDLCYLSCVDALQKLTLPRLYIMDTIQTKVSVKSKRSTTRGLISTNKAQLNIDTNKELYYPIAVSIKPGSISSNFGIVKHEDTTILLTDLQGQEEESSILSRMSIITNKSGSINRISLISGEGDISLELLNEALEISKRRSIEGVI
ncbi:Exosome complex component RRP43 [Spathaspora sp. JA1]|nr:Exosome complex component RRP43 [Spathaspora sp. JA1]